jgi:hypothetical protein
MRTRIPQPWSKKARARHAGNALGVRNTSIVRPRTAAAPNTTIRGHNKGPRASEPWCRARAHAVVGERARASQASAIYAADSARRPRPRRRQPRTFRVRRNHRDGAHSPQPRTGHPTVDRAHDAGPPHSLAADAHRAWLRPRSRRYTPGRRGPHGSPSAHADAAAAANE